RGAYGKALVELGKNNPNIVVLDADLSCSTQTAMFAKEFPERFFNVGIAEQNLIPFPHAHSVVRPVADGVFDVSVNDVVISGKAYERPFRSVVLCAVCRDHVVIVDQSGVLLHVGKTQEYRMLFDLNVKRDLFVLVLHLVSYRAAVRTFDGPETLGRRVRKMSQAFRAGEFDFFAEQLCPRRAENELINASRHRPGAHQEREDERRETRRV
ncbi:MAG: hypothetical protein J6Z80_00275, partial [Clostridia bacterium]|nr:hypothetical protein [Clostridia bacterium]